MDKDKNYLIQEKDTGIKSKISSLRAHAELFAIAEDGYLSVCTSDKFISVLSDIEESGANNLTCYDTALSWFAKAQLNDNSYFCVDSTGYAGRLGGSSLCAI